MNQEQIIAAKARAEEVVNGFVRVREQQARDVLKLVEKLEEKDREIAALKKKVAGKAFMDASRAGNPNVDWRDIFGGR